MPNFMEFVQDDSRANSVKRLVFLTLAGLYVALCVVPMWRGYTDAALYSFISSSQDKVKDLLEWIGAFILAENVTPAISRAVQTQKSVSA